MQTIATRNEDERVIAFSKLLNNLPIHPNNVRGQNFPNPDGVAFKLGNFRRIDPSDPRKGFSGASHTDRAVWKEFS